MRDEQYKTQDLEFYRDQIESIFIGYDSVKNLTKHLTFEDVKLIDDKTNVNWGDFSPIVNAYGSGFIEGYLIGKYG